jgi:hypothetical protein
MNRKIFLKILLGVVILVLLIKLLTIVFIEPWIEKRIETELNGQNGNYLVEINKVYILIIRSGIELDSITICSKQDHEDIRNFKL